MPLEMSDNGDPRPAAERDSGAPHRVLLTNDDGADSEFFIAWTAYVQDKLG
jgi:hypothetical protein